MEEKPKSAIDIAMARLDAMNREAGIVETPLTDTQKKEISEARQVCAAQIAELEILLRDALHKTGDPEARTRLEAEFQTDRRRAAEDRDRAIDRIRRGTAGAPP